jgi:hypothetical protein
MVKVVVVKADTYDEQVVELAMKKYLELMKIKEFANIMVNKVNRHNLIKGGSLWLLNVFVSKLLRKYLTI